MDNSQAIPTVDLFAGPGGRGEGFSALGRDVGAPPFRLCLSIERDACAHQTLTLRSFFRQFPDAQAPCGYYNLLRQTERPLSERLKELYDSHPDEAERAHGEAWLQELNKNNTTSIRARITAALGETEEWVLLGGPPCQAYSVAGRSRNSGNAVYDPDADHRQTLYVEYLQVIADHRPAVFIMENVKGVLSATHRNQRVFRRIYDDLQQPAVALKREGRTLHNGCRSSRSGRYRLYSLAQHGMFTDSDLCDFVVRMERYGIPQARHRLVLIGVRDDLPLVTPDTLTRQDPVPVRDVLAGLPRVRSGLSRTMDSPDRWLAVLQKMPDRAWFKSAELDSGDLNLHNQMVRAVKSIRRPEKDRGADFVDYNPSIKYRQDWFLDPRIGGVFNHSTRAHILKDLYRYFYVSCFGRTTGYSPTLANFPKGLLPKHDNVANALGGGYFADRFRVQIYERPATTITSHIAKDGHYYIHPDPTQSRSLTVREAARIQTFPDNYYFCGPRTSQYTQVGNAVPTNRCRQRTVEPRGAALAA